MGDLERLGEAIGKAVFTDAAIYMAGRMDIYHGLHTMSDLPVIGGPLDIVGRMIQGFYEISGGSGGDHLVPAAAFLMLGYLAIPMLLRQGNS